MRPFLEEKFGNPSSPYGLGAEAQAAVSEARRNVSGLLGCRASEIVFTSSGTESNNLAVSGVVRRRLAKSQRLHIVTQATEHHSVLRVCEAWQSLGAEVTVLETDGEGRVDPENVREALRDETALVTIQGANNETGVLQPLEEIAAVLAGSGALFHTDAVQLAGKVPVGVGELGVDLLSVASHKIYGPKGAGALYVRDGVELEPLLYGGGQEGGLRAGTEDVPALVGFGEAARWAAAELKEFSRAAGDLRDDLERRIGTSFEGLRFNGREAPRVPNTTNFSLTGVDGEAALLALETEGVAVSSGAACASGSAEPSHVLLAMGLSAAEAKGSIRVSLGRTTGRADTEQFLEIFVPIVERLRGLVRK